MKKKLRLIGSMLILFLCIEGNAHADWILSVNTNEGIESFQLNDNFLISFDDIETNSYLTVSSVDGNSTIPLSNETTIGFNNTPVRESGEQSEIMPTDFVLESPFPNPFNPSTTIRLSLPHSGSISLCVYDINGREVLQLAEEVLSTGYHEFLFDASGLASGVYFVRASFAGSQTFARKALLLK